jgi:hypothetical protein
LCSNHILVICILSYFVIIALFHHQEIKDHLFGPSNSMLRYILELYGILGRKMKWLEDFTRAYLE